MANGLFTNFEWKKDDYVVSEGIDTDWQTITIIQGTALKTGSPDKNYIWTISLIMTIRIIKGKYPYISKMQYQKGLICQIIIISSQTL